MNKNNKPFFAYMKHAIAYQVHVFRSENHYIAYKTVHRCQNLFPLSQLHNGGSKMRGTPDHRYETDPAVESLEATLDGEEVDHTPVNARGETPTGESSPAPSTLVVRAVNGQTQKPYTVNGVTKWLSRDQTIYILHATDQVPARVTELGNGYIVVEIETGRSYRRPTPRRINMAVSEAIGLNFSKVLLQPTGVSR